MQAHSNGSRWIILQRTTITLELPQIIMYLQYDERMVHLDSIEAASNHILTGMRFQLAGHHMKLEIQTTPFDFETGELHIDESRWISGPDDPRLRTELKLEDPDVPITSFLNYLDLNEKQFIKFSLTSMRKDLGQNIVPYLDFQQLTSSPAVPIAEAGLIHRGDPGSGGFLSFKLYTYNFAPHLHNQIKTAANILLLNIQH